MFLEGDDHCDVTANQMAEGVTKHEQERNHDQVDLNGKILLEKGDHGEKLHSNSSDSELIQALLELHCQNEYMKSQFEGLKIRLENSDQISSIDKVTENFDLGSRDDIKELREKVVSLNRKLEEERQTRDAAEKALKHLGSAQPEMDEKFQELLVKLAEAEHKKNQEIKERDEKYAELDAKFNRLHKRAKQRIQDLQKEKDDVETKLHDVAEKADHSSSQLSVLQKELEHTRQRANDALKSMDVERQQLRSANNKLRDNIEELRLSLVRKESELEALQQSLEDKEQKLEEMQVLLQAADEKRQASITELSLKHQKQVESMEAQIADVLAERSKACDTISSLRNVIIEKDTKIAEMDAASSGEAARLRAAMEALKGELNHHKIEHDKDRESLEANFQTMRSRLEISESNRINAEIEAAKLKSQLESEHSVQTQLLKSKDAELEDVREKVNQIQMEFSSYKVRAHSLLQKKDAELAAMTDNEQLKVLEEALKEAEREILAISEEKDNALQDLKNDCARYEKEIATRDAALSIAEQHFKDIQTKLDSAFSQHQSEKEVWHKNLHDVEETWKLRYDALHKQSELSSGENTKREVEELKLHCKKLKEDQTSFHYRADIMMEEKDKEISRLKDDNKNLRLALDSRPPAHCIDDFTALQKQESSSSNISATEQQILILARQQAQREEELSQTQRHILALQEEIEELEHENRLCRQQEAKLKEEFRNMERKKKREGVDMTYVKNVILKLLETGEVERLLPVVATLLQFSPDEVQKCQQAYRSSAEVPASPSNESSLSGLSLFSRFSFS